MSLNPVPIYFFLTLLGLMLLLLVGYVVRHFVREPESKSPAIPSRSILASQSTLGLSAEPTATSVVRPKSLPIPAGPPRALPPGYFVPRRTRVLTIALLPLACVVALGFLTILLPDRTIQRWSQALRLLNAPPGQEEPIAFLYMGHEVNGQELHIRGQIRNISTLPIEQLEANIRLFGPDGKLLDNALVPMETETIPPDATTSFGLIYPDASGKVATYSVGFKLRDGEPVTYKNMRGAR